MGQLDKEPTGQQDKRTTSKQHFTTKTRGNSKACFFLHCYLVISFHLPFPYSPSSSSISLLHPFLLLSSPFLLSSFISSLSSFSFPLPQFPLSSFISPFPSSSSLSPTNSCFLRPKFPAGAGAWTYATTRLFRARPSLEFNLD